MSNHKLYALVTGGNRGIGLEVCRQLVERNKPILLACRNVEAGQAIAADLAKAGIEVKCVELDTGSTESVQQLADLIKHEYNQKIDLLVNNAGILVDTVWDKEAYDRTLTINTTGPIILSQALLPLLAPGALIVNVSSGLGQLSHISSDYVAAVQAVDSLAALTTPAATVPFKPDSPMGTNPPGMGSRAPTYSVAKALLNRGVQLMAADSAFKERGVSVVSVCPGWCRTDMGTAAADRSGNQGAASVLWPFVNWNSSLNGGFTRDGEALEY